MNVLCVCTGNINRSPALEVILRSMAPENWRIRSAALNPRAPVGRPTTARMRRVLNEYGFPYPPEPIRSRHVTAEMIAAADAVLYMQPSHLAALRECYPEHEGKFTSAGQLAGMPRIPDPQFSGVAAYHRAVLLLAAAARNFLNGIPGEPCAA